MVLLSSAFFEITFTTNFDVVCVPHGMGVTTVIYTVAYIIVYGVCCSIISIIFSILTVRYVKENTISENKQKLKRLTGFAVLLLIGNSFNIVGTSLPLIIAISTPVGGQHETIVNMVM